MHAELTKLLDLQTRDLSLFEVDARLTSILAEIAKLDAELDAGRREIQVAEKRLADGVTKRGDLEGRIEGYRAVEARRKERLELARGAREAQAVMTEVEMARAVLAREEQEWVKVAEGVTDLERGAKTSRERLTEVEAKQSEERERLAAEQAALEAERDAARSERNGVATGIDKTLRARYDRLRSARSVAVVVALRGEACGACYTSVPRNRRTQIRAGILLDNCEACGVILYAEDASS
ncbi:MAG: zinc ribbon domain-containing protein [Gemmatimonadales bacterium]